jgi:hypothetical protein
MSFNGSGSFLINTAGQPVVSGTVISSTAFNALTADLATGLSTCITKDGQTTVTANIPMANYKFTGLGVGSGAADSANLSQVQSTVVKLLASVSGTDTITAVGSPTVAAYAAGQMFYFVAAGDNTGAVTLNIDSLGAKAVTRDGSVALAAGDIKSGEVVVIVYDGTRFQVVSQLNSSGDARFANVSIASALNVGGVATFSAGTAAAPAITTTGDTNTGIFFPAADTIAFAEGGVESMRLDSSGNLGLGVTPSAWSASVKALEIPSGSLFAFSTSETHVTQNAIFDGAWKYKNTGAALDYQQTAGRHAWFNAPSGTAGGTISFTQAMTLDASGNLLVGTTTANTYSGYSTFQLGQSTSGSIINFQGGATSTSSAAHIRLDCSGTTVSSLTIETRNQAGTASAPILFKTQETERARITSGGGFLVGSNPSEIGTNSVTAASSGSTANGFACLVSGYAAAFFGINNTASTVRGVPASSFGVGTADGIPLTFATNNTERARITSGGDFCIGATSANSILQVTKNASNATDGITLSNNTEGEGYGSAISFRGAFGAPSATDQLVARISGFVTGPTSTKGGILAFSTGTGGSVTERARITSGGYSKFSNDGTYYGSAASYHELRQTGTGVGAVVSASNASYTNDILYVTASRNTTDGTFNYFVCYNDGSANFRLKIADSGNVTNVNGSYGTISDAKMKTDIVDAGSQWDDLKAVRFRKFKMKDDPQQITQLGVVAQELEQTSPGLVDEHADRDAEGNDLGTTTKSVKSSILLMKAAVALQEAMARIEKLEAEVAALKGA